ncbi:hypothetical protein C8R46DRAFT_1060518 [Mycena filopes]|nr:hypothetical protein C8R46DRAFT_1060518 [Mycena filopes]
MKIESEEPGPLSPPTGNSAPPLSDAENAIDALRARRRRVHRCSACLTSFTVLSDLRKHESTHDHDSEHVHRPSVPAPKVLRFIADSPGCTKQSGFRANLTRNQEGKLVGVKKARKSRPSSGTPAYAVKFVEPYIASPVQSDTTPMPVGVIWDADGPLAYRPHPSVAPQVPPSGDNL